MKNQKGITLVSLTIYIIVVIIVVAILATVRDNFQSGVKEMSEGASIESEFNKFNLYFLEDIKKLGNTPTIVNENEIKFLLTGNTYKFDKKNVSDDSARIVKMNEITLLSDIKSCKFEQKEQEGKTIITVTIKFINYKDLSKNQTITKEYIIPEEQAENNYEYEGDYIYTQNTTTNEVTNEMSNESGNQINNQTTNET